MKIKKQKRVKIGIHSFKKINANILSFFMFVSFLCSSLTISAQDYLISRNASDYPLTTVILEDCGPSADQTCITLPDIDPTLGYSFTVPLDQENYPGSLITLITVDNCVEASIVVDITNGKIDFPANANICGGGIIEFTAHANYDNPPQPSIIDSVFYKIKYKQKPVKLAFVLDISGSMRSPVYNGISYGDTRLQVLKNAVSAFLTKFELVDGANDLIGLTYFTTNVVPSNPPLGDALISSVGSETVVSADMSIRNPLSMTAMGLGLKKAKDDLLGGNNNDGYKKIILLFTDGLQNVNPLAHTEEISPGVYATYLGPDLDNYRLNNDGILKADSIYYYCIAMNTGTGVPLLLKDLAEKNGGNAYFTSFGVYGTCNPPDATQDCDLMNDFDEALQKILYGGSPQLVSRTISSLSNGNQSFSFDINDNVSNIIFEIDYRKGDYIKFEEIKNGEYNLTNDFNYIYSKDSVFLIASLKLPYQFESNLINSKGKWDVKLSGNSENNFAFKCFVDDHYFDFKCSTGKNIYTVGDTLKFNANISYAGNPLVQSNEKVSVVLLKPGDDIGHLLATYDTPDSQTDSIDPASPAQQKLYSLLLNDSSFYQKLKANDMLIELQSDGNGRFENVYTNTELTGVYQAYFFISADHSGFGKFIRTQKQSLVLKFGQVEPETPKLVDNSSVSNTPVQDPTGTTPPDTTTVSDQDKRNKLIILKIRPKNIFGYYMGPGFKSVINVVINPEKKKLHAASLLPVQPASSEPFVTEIRDNLDGSYYIFIAGIAARTNPVIQIKISDEVLYEGKVCPVPLWVYILLIILLILLILMRYYKSKNIKIYKIILWIIALFILLLILLQYYGFLKIFC